MPEENLPIKLGYKLLNSNTGVVVVADLFHINGSTWTTRALLPGYPGSTTLGDFKILLPPPYSEEHARYRAQYDAILNSSNRGIGLKVEGYLNDVNAGAPIVSGVITKMHLPLDGPWELIGSDTLYWLQQSQLLPGEIFAAPIDGVLPTETLEIVQALSCTQEVVWDDDFSGGAANLTANYNSSGWSFTASDPYQGLPALTSTTTAPGIAYATTKTTWSNAAQYCYSGISIHGTMAGGTDSTTANQAAVLLVSDATIQNGVLCEAILRQVSAGLYNVDGKIFSVAAGVYTQQAISTDIYTNVRSPFTFEVSVTVSENAGKQEIRLNINGKTGAVFWQPAGGLVPGSGGVGIWYGPQAAGGPVVYVNRIQFHARTQPLGAAWATSRFGAGTQVSDGASIATEIPGNNSTHLDMLMLAATVGGSLIRKNPGAGFKGDTLDYSSSPGVDRSTQIMFEEGINIDAQGTSLQNVAEIYSTDAKINAIPTSDSGGSVVWGRIGASGDIVLVDTVSDVGTAGFSFLIAYAKLIQSRKNAPIVATQVKVMRTSDLLRANRGFGPRELDFVQVHLPTFNILHQKALIVGYTFTEGEGTMIYYITQLPSGHLAGHLLQRLVRTIDYVSTTYQSRTGA